MTIEREEYEKYCQWMKDNGLPSGPFVGFSLDRWIANKPHDSKLLSAGDKVDRIGNAAERKAHPLFSGVMNYFPNALLEVAHTSKVGNDQHNPDEPLHWAREKSNDHMDCAARHMLDFKTMDVDGVRHGAKAIWRLLAELELTIEAERATAQMSGSRTSSMPETHQGAYSEHPAPLTINELDHIDREPFG